MISSDEGGAGSYMCGSFSPGKKCSILMIDIS